MLLDNFNYSIFKRRKTSWAGDEVGFDFCDANLNPVWAMTACYDL